MTKGPNRGPGRVRTIRTMPPVRLLPRGARRPGLPDIVGLHHVRAPVSNVVVTRDWYIDVLGFFPLLVVEEEDGVIGVALEHPSGVVVGLHREPEMARALRGFAILALTVPDICAWVDHLDAGGYPHGEIIDGHRGRYVQLSDPDGLVVELHTPGHPSADEA